MSGDRQADAATYPGRVFEAEVRRFWEADRLHVEGLALMRQNLRRRHPGESAEEIEVRLRTWLLDRPADAPGPHRAEVRTET